MALMVEVFMSDPPCSGGRLVRRLVEEIKEEYGERIEVEYYRGICDKSQEYNLKVSPVIIIDGDVRIIGVCPTKATLRDALREAGL